MPNFQYKAVNDEGMLVRNKISAPNEQEVIHHLQKLKLTPVEIRSYAPKSAGKGFQKKVRTKEVIFFTKQLYTLLKSGVPILMSLNAIKEQSSNPTYTAVVEQIAREVEQGNSLSSALSQFSKIFPSVYIDAVKVGEISGTLEESLHYLSKYLEEEEKIKKDIKKAVRYPILVVVGLIFAFIIFTTMVIPKFIPIFSSSGIELPLPTRILFGFHEILAAYGIYIILAIAGVAIFLIWYGRTARGRYIFDEIFLKLPIMGQLIRKVNISRFAKTFYTMNRTGIPVIQAFETLKTTLENAVYRKELNMVLERVKAGGGIANSLRLSSYFDPFAVEMIAIGEKSGSLDDMLQSVSGYYDLEVSETVDNMTSLIEPVVTVALGVMVLIFALSIFLPMWDLMSLVK
ncbi:MAG: type II secretion system F family protein [Calditrichia bacterium]